MSVERDLAELLAWAEAGVSDLARENLGRDVRALLERARAGEYERTDFEARNIFDVARRTHEFLAYLGGWSEQAEAWAQVFERLELTGDESIAHLCPGWAPKLELALARRGHRGRVSLIDKRRSGPDRIVAFLRLLTGALDVEVIEEDLFAASEATYALVLANHVVDDLLLEEAAAALSIDPPRVYEDEATLERALGELVRREDRRGELMARLARAIGRRVAPRGRVVVTHYPSYVSRITGAERVERALEDAFIRLRRELSSLGLVELPGDTSFGSGFALPAHVFVRPVV